MPRRRIRTIPAPTYERAPRSETYESEAIRAMVLLGSRIADGQKAFTAIGCWRILPWTSPRRQCWGSISIAREDAPRVRARPVAGIWWRCDRCSWEGAVVDWRGTPWDYSDPN